MAASEKVKVYKLGTEPAFPKDYTVTRRVTLNFTDIAANNNKYYNLELFLAKNGQAEIYSQYGRVGAPNPAKEIRVCDNESHANNLIDKIIKEKTKKGYVEVKLVKAEVGSELGKQIVTASTVSEDTAKKLGYKIEEVKKSSLHPKVQDLVKVFFGSIEKFVVDTLDTSKCALGQLSLEQINKGRELLLEARKIIGSSKDINELNSLTSKFYSNIPMNFGYRRLDADTLRFDTDGKIDNQLDILETLEGARGVEKVLTKRSDIDDKYNILKCGIEWIDPSDPIFKWIDFMFHKTRASNHSNLGKMRVSNVFKLIRDNEHDIFMEAAERIAKNSIHKRNDLPDVYKPIWNERLKEDKQYEDLMERANILPLYHGSKTCNFVKILPTQLKLPRNNFTISGAMFSGGAGGLYFASNASKSCQYSSTANSFYSKGNDNKGYLFIADVILGKQHIATRPYPFTLDHIKPAISVFAKRGSSVINDEMIVFSENHDWLRYIVEFETNLR